MADPAQQEQELLATPLPEGAAILPAPFVFPRYNGYSIANLPATIGHLLGVVDGWQGPPLDPRLWGHLANGVERVIFLLTDGIGWRRLWQTIHTQDEGFPDELARVGATLTPITTICPSTTSVATTTLWCNGALPAQHGMVGYQFRLADYSAVCNMLFWKPTGNLMHQKADTGSLVNWGLKPEAFLPVPSVAMVLAEQGIETASLMPNSIMHSPLSKMQKRGAKLYGYMNQTQMWIRMRQWLTSKQGEKAFLSVYYDDFDGFSHQDGPDALTWDSLWREFRFHLREFWQDVPAGERGRTLLLISADHGHVQCPPHRHLYLDAHPRLQRYLASGPGGEPRQIYLYVRPGYMEAVRDYHLEHFDLDFLLLTGEEAIGSGLYGDPRLAHPDLERRIGDYVLFSRHDATAWMTPVDHLPIGMHGSLHPNEMIVPLIAMRLEA